jgi:hypothetical protein
MDGAKDNFSFRKIGLLTFTDGAEQEQAVDAARQMIIDLR